MNFKNNVSVPYYFDETPLSNKRSLFQNFQNKRPPKRGRLFETFCLIKPLFNQTSVVSNNIPMSFNARPSSKVKFCRGTAFDAGNTATVPRL